MKRSMLLLVLTLSCVCSNAVAAATTNASAHRLLEISKGEYTAFQHQDWTTMGSLTTADFLYVGPEGRLSGRELAEATNSCVLRSFDLSSSQMKRLTTTSAVLTYIATQDENCGGKQMPGKLLNADVFVLAAGRWRVSIHMELALPGALN